MLLPLTVGPRYKNGKLSIASVLMFNQANPSYLYCRKVLYLSRTNGYSIKLFDVDYRKKKDSVKLSCQEIINRRTMKLIKRIGISILLLYFISYFFFLIFGFYKLKYYGRCTVGEVTGYYETSKSGKNLTYKFMVNRAYYTGASSWYKDNYLGNKYFVIYNESTPEMSVICLEHPTRKNLGDTINNCKKDNLFIKILKASWNIPDMYFKSSASNSL